MVESGLAEVYDFTHNEVPGVTDRERGYWRDVGTLDSYFDASHGPDRHRADLQPVQRSSGRSSRPAPPPLRPKWWLWPNTVPGQVADSILSNGVILSGAYVRNSVLSPNVRVDPGAIVEDSILLEDVHIGKDAVVRRTVIDKNVRVPPGSHIGVDPDRDRARFEVSPGGIVAIAKGEIIDEPV